MKKFFKKLFDAIVIWCEWMSYPACPECGGSLHVKEEEDRTIVECDKCSIKYTIKD